LENPTKLKLQFNLSLAAMSIGALAEEPIQPIRPVQSINLGQVDLAKMPYFDPRRSKTGCISCNSCHNLSVGGTDNLKTSTSRHSPASVSDRAGDVRGSGPTLGSG